MSSFFSPIIKGQLNIINCLFTILTLAWLVQTSKGKYALHFLFCLWFVYVVRTCLFVCFLVCFPSFFFFKCVGLHVDCFVKYQWMCFMLYREISTAFKKKLYIQFPHFVSFYMLYSERNTNTRSNLKQNTNHFWWRVPWKW